MINGESNIERSWKIYIHTNKINGKVYIGQTCQGDVERRWRKDGSGYKPSKNSLSNNSRFWNAIQKYGWDNFDHEIIEEVDSQEKANELERKYIALHNSTDENYGYNMQPGGINSSISMTQLWQNEEYRQKMSESFKKARKRDWANEDFKNAREKDLLAGVARFWLFMKGGDDNEGV